MGVKQRASRLLNHPWKELSQFQKSYVKNKIIKIGNLKIPGSMVHQYNLEDQLHNFCLIDFKSSLGMLNSSNNDIQQKKNAKSLTQPEQHWSQCIHGNSIGLGLLEGLTHHGEGVAS